MEDRFAERKLSVSMHFLKNDLESFAHNGKNERLILFFFVFISKFQLVTLDKVDVYEYFNQRTYLCNQDLCNEDEAHANDNRSPDMGVSGIHRIV